VFLKDEKSIITYVSLLYDAMPTIPVHPNHIQREKEKHGLLLEYSLIYKQLKRWIDESIHIMSNRLYPNDFIELKVKTVS
jgi:hypothetical protein